MERMGGKEQLLEQMYSAMATRRDETVDLALRSYGTLPRLPSHVPNMPVHPSSFMQPVWESN